MFLYSLQLFNFSFQIQLDTMSVSIITNEVWRWYDPTPYGMYGLEVHFTFMIDADTTQMISLAYFKRVDSLDDYFPDQ